MNAITKSPIKEHNRTNLSPSRSQEFTVDDIIDAYEKECMKGISVYSKKMRKDIRMNLQSALPVIEEFFDSINGDAKRKIMFIRLSNRNKFDLIVAIDEDVFFNDEVCKPIYLKSFELRKKHQNINISFIPCGNNLNIEILNFDNFIPIYGTLSSLENAKHDEKACAYLSKKSKFKVWFITNAFYSAVNYNRHLFLPLNEEGLTYKLYKQKKSFVGGRHGFQSRPIPDLRLDVSFQYNRLHDMLNNAIYSNYLYIKESEALANKYFEEIKSHILKGKPE